MERERETEMERNPKQQGGVAERESLYLDEQHASEVGRVIDESPLTDLDGELDGEGSDLGSTSEQLYYQPRPRYHGLALAAGLGELPHEQFPAPASPLEIVNAEKVQALAFAAGLKEQPHEPHDSLGCAYVRPTSLRRGKAHMRIARDIVKF